MTDVVSEAGEFYVTLEVAVETGATVLPCTGTGLGFTIIRPKIHNTDTGNFEGTPNEVITDLDWLLMQCMIIAAHYEENEEIMTLFLYILYSTLT